VRLVGPATACHRPCYANCMKSYLYDCLGNVTLLVPFRPWRVFRLLRESNDGQQLRGALGYSPRYKQEPPGSSVPKESRNCDGMDPVWKSM